MGCRALKGISPVELEAYRTWYVRIIAMVTLSGYDPGLVSE